MTPWIRLDTFSLSFIRNILVPNPEQRLTLDGIEQHRWCQNQFPAIIVQDENDAPPSAKRLRSSLDANTNFDDSLARMSSSQPLPSVADNISHDTSNVEARNDYCYSQPAHLSDLLISSQFTDTTQPTQLNSNPFQKLVRRMTRFFVSTRIDETLKRLTLAFDKFGWTWKFNDDSTVTIITTDRRNIKLVFKANLINMNGNLLLDFRLSKGCGLDFKRNFVKIRESKEIAESILKLPMHF